MKIVKDVQRLFLLTMPYTSPRSLALLMRTIRSSRWSMNCEDIIEYMVTQCYHKRTNFECLKQVLARPIYLSTVFDLELRMVREPEARETFAIEVYGPRKSPRRSVVLMCSACNAVCKMIEKYSAYTLMDLC